MSTPDPLAAWEELSSKELLKTPYYSVIQKEMRTPSGSDATYYMHSSKDGVLCVCISDDGNVLIARQYRPPIGRVSVDYPAGGLEPGDKDTEAGIRRELMEEAGFEATELTQLATLDQNPGQSTTRIHIFLARGSVRHNTSFDDTESIVTEFVPPAHILELIASGEMSCTFCVSATFLAFKKLGLLTFGSINN